MKNTTIIAAILSTILGACTQSSNTDGQETPSTTMQAANKLVFSQTLFSALKNNRFDNYSKRFINSSDLDYFFLMKLRNRLERLTPSRAQTLKKSIVEARKTFPAKRKVRLRSLKSAFDNFRELAINKGVNWKLAQFKGAQFENTRHIHKIATADIIITFTNNKKHYVFKIPRCQLVRRGWIYSEPPKWEGLYK